MSYSLEAYIETLHEIKKSQGALRKSVFPSGMGPLLRPADCLRRSLRSRVLGAKEGETAASVPFEALSSGAPEAHRSPLKGSFQGGYWAIYGLDFLEYSELGISYGPLVWAEGL